MCIRDRAIRLALFRNNMSNEWPAWEIIKSVIDAEPESIKEDVKITIEENGGLRSVLKVERKYGDSKFTQRICLTEGAADDRIDIITDIDWATKASLLKAEFPLSVSNKEATYDLGLGLSLIHISLYEEFFKKPDHTALEHPCP